LVPETGVRTFPPQLAVRTSGFERTFRACQRCCSLRCWHASDAFRAIERRRTVERPPYEQLVADRRELSWVAVGAKYGVSDNAVRKWLRRYEREGAA